jgi:uncharacterized protein (TIGR00290 family)
MKIPRNNLSLIASWSGGKDSCLALHHARLQGYQVEYLLNFISREYKRCCFHGIESALISAQAQSLGITLVQHEVSPDMKDYEIEFKEAVSRLREQGSEGMLFGDVYLDDHREWVERVCRELGIQAVEPLWGRPAQDVVEEFLHLGYEAVVVSAKADIFGQEIVGRTLDRDLVQELVRKGICPCGENGEFHTLVVAGPLFRKKIEILKAQPILKKGFWEHWFLDIQEWRLI